MINKRIIPVLLLKNKGFYKTTRFRNPSYIGDPLNTIRIFNEKEADELIILDIGAYQAHGPNFDVLKEIARESFSPMAYGGGITSLEDAKKIFSIGFEKIVLNTLLHTTPSVVEEIVKLFGSQAVVGCIEIKRNFLRQPQIYTCNGTQKLKDNIQEHIKKIMHLGLGEIFVNNIDREGTRKGYDIGLMKEIATVSTIPVVACGGAYSLQCIEEIFSSLFIYHGIHKAVLITYPTFEESERIKNGKR